MDATKIAKIPNLPVGSWVRNLFELGYQYDDIAAVRVKMHMFTDERINKRIMGEITNAEFPQKTGWNPDYFIIISKLMMLWLVRDFLQERGFEFDEFNKKRRRTSLSKYFSYEFSALWLWTEMVFSAWSGSDFGNCWYLKYQEVIESTFKKYPDIMLLLSSELDLRVPGNKFLDSAPEEIHVEGY